MKTLKSNYSGWKNYQTWNVALWIQNEYSIYCAAYEYVKNSKRPSYIGFVRSYGLADSNTPDRIKWNGTKLDYKALNQMMLELVS